MADLTLNEFRDIHEKDLKGILRDEARIICSADAGRSTVVTSVAGSGLLGFVLRNWTKIITFLSSKHIPLIDRLS